MAARPYSNNTGVNLDDLFGTAPSQPPPPHQQQQYNNNNNNMYYQAPPPPPPSGGDNDLPPPPYMEDQNDSIKYNANNTNTTNNNGYNQSQNGGYQNNAYNNNNGCNNNMMSAPPPFQQQQQAPPPPSPPQQPSYSPYNTNNNTNNYPQSQGYYGQPPTPPQPYAATAPATFNTSTSSNPYSAAPAPAAPAATSALSQEDEDRQQLEKIIRLRRELEQEQQQEEDKKREKVTWGCLQCTYRNALQSDKCEMCQAPRPGGAPSAGAGLGGSGMGAAVPAGRPAGATAWQCPACLAPNEAGHSRCFVCQTPRPPGSSNLQQQQAPPRQGGADPYSPTPFTCDWRCSMCGMVNAPSRANCKGCNGYQRNGTPVGLTTGAAPAPAPRPAAPASADPPPPTTWTCSVCTLENKVKHSVCKACKSGQRPRHLAPKAGGPAPGSGSAAAAPAAGAGSQKEWPCPQCTFNNPALRLRCDMCGAARPAQYGGSSSTSPGLTPSQHRATEREAQSDEDEEVMWQKDQHAVTCNRCKQPFGLMRRRHHCRACGYVFCATCSPFYTPLRKDGQPERVCVECYEARNKK